MPKIDLSATVSKVTGRSGNFDQDSFGVEIEVEGRKLLARNTTETAPYWHIGADGSLRTINEGDQALEYKFVKPLNAKDTLTALELLEAKLTKPDVTLYPSPRASVHVHVNVLSETTRTLYNFITLSYLFEEVLVDMCGSHRIGNNFCLRAKDAEGIIVELVRNLTTYGHTLGDGREYRYAATNICSISKFGTVEFRALEFTVDSKRIFDWVMTLQSLKEAARGFQDPREIVSQFSLKGPRQFFLDIIGATRGAKYVMGVKDLDRKLGHGMRLVQDFAYCTDWVDSGGKAQAKVKQPDWAVHPALEVDEQPPAPDAWGERLVAPANRWANGNNARPIAGGGGIARAVPGGGFADMGAAELRAARERAIRDMERRQQIAEERARDARAREADAARQEDRQRILDRVERERRAAAAIDNGINRLNNGVHPQAQAQPRPRARPVGAPAGLGRPPRQPGEF